MATERFYLHTSNQLEKLADSLLEIVDDEPLEGLLSLETVMSLNSGMARWLRLYIAEKKGIAMNWDFPFPAKTFGRLLSGFESHYEELGQFSEASAKWIIYENLGDLENSDQWTLVKRYCEEGPSLNRLQLASRLAYLYDQYLIYRPDLIVSWENASQPKQWQGSLWKLLANQIFTTKRPPHIARIWDRIRNYRHKSVDKGNWPQRLSVFGISSLPPLYLDLLKFCSQFIPIHIFALQPTDLYWSDLRTEKQVLKASRKRSSELERQLGDASQWIFDSGNPLLPALGRQSQMFLDLLIDRDPQHDDSAFQASTPSNQLSVLQRDLFTLTDRKSEENASSDKPPFPSYDGSIEIHNCHSPRREIEALKDYLIDAAQRDPELTASDIIVMAPDIHVYVPSIESVFETVAGEDEFRLPFSLADQSQANQSSLAAALTSILQLPGTRMETVDILRIIEKPSIKEQFRFGDFDLDIIKSWIQEAGTTWGWNAEGRENRNAFATDRCTWREFRQRLAAGLALPHTNRNLRFGALPIEGLEGDQAALAGRFLEFLSVIDVWISGYHSSLPIKDWRELFIRLFDTLFAKTMEQESERTLILDTIGKILPSNCDSIATTGREAAYLLMQELERESPRSGFLSGNLTFCSIKPMRSLPAKIICLLGMNYGDYPRRARQDSLDLQLRDPRPGDRNPKDEDRQLFLEALLSARQRLRISYCGMSTVSDENHPPSTVVSELLGYLDDAMSSSETGLLSEMVFNHKRQPYDSEYFLDTQLYTYSEENARIHNILNRKSESEKINITGLSLSTRSDSESLIELSIDDFIRRFTRPQQSFLQQGKGVKFYSKNEDPFDLDFLTLNGLQNYELRKAFSDAIENLEKPEAATQEWMEAARLLPPGKLADIEYSNTFRDAKRLDELWEQNASGANWAEERIIIKDESISLVGRLFLNGEKGCQAILADGALNPRRMIDAWLRHVIACKYLISTPPEQVATYVFSMADVEKIAVFSPLESVEQYWTILMDWLQKSHDQPLEFVANASYFCAEKLHKSKATKPEATYDEALRAASAQLKGHSWNGKDFPETDVYFEACFGSDYQPDETFLKNAEELLLPLFAHLETLLSDKLGAGFSENH